MILDWKNNAENSLKNDMISYLNEKTYRFTSYIENESKQAKKKGYHDVVDLEKCNGNFLQYLDHNSGLEIISKEQLDENKVKDAGLMRFNV